MYRLLSLSLLPVVLSVAGPALAQDAGSGTSTMPAPAPYPDPVSESRKADDKLFSGLYVAASGGYDVQSNDLGSQLNFDRNGDGKFNDVVTNAAGANVFSPGFCNGRARGATLTANGGCENDRNRASYYGRVGFDVQPMSALGGSIVLGVLGEFGRSDIKDYVSGFSNAPNSYVMERGIDWEASGRLRAGYARGIGMFYTTGGIGYARFQHRFETTNTANSFSTLLNDRDKFGFVLGGGVELRVMRHISLGMEYTYHDYKDGQYLVRVGQGSAGVNNAFVLAPYTSGTTIARSDNDFRWHSLRGVIGYHF